MSKIRPLSLHPALKKLNGKKIALLGLGLDNRALLSLLKTQKIKTEITIRDAKQDPKNFNKNLSQFNYLFRSPGWPLSCSGLEKARRKGRTTITSPLNLFFALCPTKNIIGITGTKGKGTTASLIYKILKEAGKKVWLGGNIGIPPLSFLEKIKPSDYVVLELSSFQLEDLQFSPRLAVITNLFPEHLAAADPHNPNFHPSLASYWRAKLNIAAKPGNQYLVANRNLEKRLKKTLPGERLSYFTASALPSRLTGDYNRENIGAAAAVAKILKIKPIIYRKTIARFANLEHRLEFVAAIKGVRYFDNSFSTTPESTSLDLKSFSTPIIQIAGGADKGASFKKLARLIKQKIKFLILLQGRATPRLKKELLKINFPAQKMKTVDSMEQAVVWAKRQAQAGDIVLLSTACASFGLFKNYKERGKLFQRYVRKKT